MALESQIMKVHRNQTEVQQINWHLTFINKMQGGKRYCDQGFQFWTEAHVVFNFGRAYQSSPSVHDKRGT
jgi:hypothetical protein